MVKLSLEIRRKNTGMNTVKMQLKVDETADPISVQLAESIYTGIKNALITAMEMTGEFEIQEEKTQ